MQLAVVQVVFAVVSILVLYMIHTWDHEDNADAPMSRDE